jgi:hypothetical protein
MAQPAYTPPTRPLGVAIIAFLLGLFGFVTFLGGLLIVVLSNTVLNLGAAGLFGATGTLLGIVLIILGLIELGVAVGLWRLRMWALVVAVLILLFEVVGPLVGLALGRGSGSLLDLVVALLLLIYLIAVRHHFR